MVLLGTKLNWKVASVHLEIALNLTQAQLGDVGHVESRSVRLEMVLV